MKYFFVILITLSATPSYHQSPHQQFTVWNVGQGQWTTFVSYDQCLHFDFGGEFFPWQKARKLCEKKKNLFFLSHWDWDHIGGLARLPARWDRHKTCIALRPQGKSTRKKMKLINSFKSCPDVAENVKIWTPPAVGDSNSQSHVLSFKNILLPGDSPKQQERRWVSSRVIDRIAVIVLGHHGSATSTSEDLLQRLPALRTAISSARWQRYGHPHPDVQARLLRARIPLLRTEDWGHLHFQQ